MAPNGSAPPFVVPRENLRSAVRRSEAWRPLRPPAALRSPSIAPKCSTPRPRCFTGNGALQSPCRHIALSSSRLSFGPPSTRNPSCRTTARPRAQIDAHRPPAAPAGAAIRPQHRPGRAHRPRSRTVLGRAHSAHHATPCPRDLPRGVFHGRIGKKGLRGSRFGRHEDPPTRWFRSRGRAGCAGP